MILSVQTRPNTSDPTIFGWNKTSLPIRFEARFDIYKKMLPLNFLRRKIRAYAGDRL